MLSLCGALGPAFVGVLSIPYVIRGLGHEAFGVLALVWVVISVCALLDLGTGRAVTKFIAEYLVRNDLKRIPTLFWTALTLNAVVGVVSAVMLALGASFLTTRLLNVSPALQQEAVQSFRILALFLPGFVVAAVLRSALEGGQRFDLTNAVQFPASSLNLLTPAIVIIAGGDLVSAILWLCISRTLAAPVLLVLCLRQFPALRRVRLFDRATAGMLLRYGGWLTFSRLIDPVLLHLDRVLLATLIGVQAVALYTAPYEVVTRVAIIPASIMLAVFPAFSSLSAATDARLGDIYARAMKHIALIMIPLCLFIAVFSREILHLWLGPEFAGQSAVAMRILALGVLLMSLSTVPYNLLQAVGRTDLVAAIHLLELPIYAAASWMLVRNFGVVGAAAAWTGRTALDAILFSGVTWRVLALRPSARRSVRPIPALLLAPAVLLFTVSLAGVRLPVGLLAPAALLFGVTYPFLVWHFVLDDTDRLAARQAVGGLPWGRRRAH